MTSIPYTSPVASPAHGLLNAQATDLLGLLFTGVVLLSLCIMLGPARESIKALWAPVGRFLAELHVTGLWEGMFVWAAFSGEFLRPNKTFWDNFPEDEDGQYREQPRRLAHRGWPERLQT